MDEQELINLRIVELKHKQFGTWEMIAEQINLEFNASLSDNAVRKRYYRQNISDLLDEMETVATKLSPYPSLKHTPNSIDDDVRTITGSENIDQLLKDSELSLNDWDVTNYNAWEAQTKIGIETLRSIRLKRRVDSFAAEKLYDLVGKLRDYSPRVPRTKFGYKVGDCLLTPCLFDAHVGKPTKENVSEMYAAALVGLITRAYNCGYNVDKILFPVGNDLSHYDTLKQTTTGGTQVSTDMSMYEIIDTVCLMMIDAIKELEQIAPVHVALVPGNHDRLSVYWLGQTLAAYFHNDDNVFVDNSKTYRKYHLWNNIFHAMTHGNEEKKSTLPSVMAVEEPVMWGKSTYREILTGHYHKQATVIHLIDEKHGIVERYIPSIGDSDDWHSLKAFIGNNRVAEALIHTKEGFAHPVCVNVGLTV